MNRLLRFLTFALLINGMVQMWQAYLKNEAERRRARELENANPVNKLINGVKAVPGRMQKRMHERMREHIHA